MHENVLTSSMKHPIKEVFNQENMIFALNWYFLAQALNTGAATVPEEETLLSWLDQPVSSDNPDDVIEVHKLQEPVFVTRPSGSEPRSVWPLYVKGGPDYDQGCSAQDGHGP